MRNPGLTRRCLLGAAATASLARPARAAVTRAAVTRAAVNGARPASAFVDSVGVCTRLVDVAFTPRFERFRALLGASGIRHIREDLLPRRSLDPWRDVQTSFGIRWNLLVSPVTNTVPGLLDHVRALGVEHFSAVEGQNEGDGWFSRQKVANGDWSGTVVAYQQAVFQAVRQRYPAATLPVVSPTLLDFRPGDVALIRAAADFCDIVALHSYVQAAQEPETQDSHAALSWYLHNYRDNFKPGAPFMVTEAGYCNLVVPGKYGISELASAVYLPRLLLANFAAGARRTFLYAFMDAGQDPHNGEDHFGLVRYDGTPKPAYEAIRALLRGLADPGGTAAVPAPDPLSLAVEAAFDLRQQIFTLSSGQIVVALWRPLRVWDVAAANDVATPPQSVSLRPAWPVARAEIMVPNEAASWVDLAIAGGRIDVPVSDRVSLLRLTGPQVSPPHPPAR